MLGLQPSCSQFVINYLCGHCVKGVTFVYKEVIQPQVPLGLPCYDFTPSHEPQSGERPPEG